MSVSFLFQNRKQILHRKCYKRKRNVLPSYFLLAFDVSLQMMTVGTRVMRWTVCTLALMTSSDVPVAGVSQGIGPVMVTMTVETSVMKHTSIVPNWVSNLIKL